MCFINKAIENKGREVTLDVNKTQARPQPDRPITKRAKKLNDNISHDEWFQLLGKLLLLYLDPKLRGDLAEVPRTILSSEWDKILKDLST